MYSTCTSLSQMKADVFYVRKAFIWVWILKLGLGSLGRVISQEKLLGCVVRGKLDPRFKGGTLGSGLHGVAQSR
jgi:hypothetical protein